MSRHSRYVALALATLWGARPGTGQVIRPDTAINALSHRPRAQLPAAGSPSWPAGMNEARLDSAYEPLIYLMTPDEQGVFSSLSLEGKRRWLQQFWERRDPTPGTVRNEDRDRFYAAIAEVDRRFLENGAVTNPGWRTDRGRVFIKYGAPDDIRERRSPAAASPYEIWRYTRNRSLTFVFMDLTGFGNYQLIYSDAPGERVRPDWMDILGPEGLKDLER